VTCSKVENKLGWQKNPLALAFMPTGKGNSFCVKDKIQNEGSRERKKQSEYEEKWRRGTREEENQKGDLQVLA
jgi:hypothetical protein